MRKEEKRLRAEVGARIDRAVAVDAAEDELYGPDKTGDEIPEELRDRNDQLLPMLE